MSFKQLLEKSSKEVRFEEIEIKTVEESWLYLSMNDSSAVKQFPQSLLIFLSPQRSVKPWTLRTQSHRDLNSLHVERNLATWN